MKIDLHKLNHTLLISATAILSLSHNAHAIVANPETMEVVCGDGITRTIRLVGDEYSNFLVSDDGCIMTTVDGKLYPCPVAQKSYNTNSQTLTPPILTASIKTSQHFQWL